VTTWGLDRISERALLLDGEYSYEYDGEGTDSYIIDTGILLSHMNSLLIVLFGVLLLLVITTMPIVMDMVLMLLVLLEVLYMELLRKSL